jgi:hypothetical protein
VNQNANPPAHSARKIGVATTPTLFNLTEQRKAEPIAYLKFQMATSIVVLSGPRVNRAAGRGACQFWGEIAG